MTAEELRDLFTVSNAAREWWEQHRPRGWTEADHLNSPVINTSGETERYLADSVAQKLKHDSVTSRGSK